METVLQEAERIVGGDRGPQYGHPTKNFEQTAALWNTYLGIATITPADVAIMMILLKISRESNRPKRDNVVDIAGYAKTLAMVRGYEDAGGESSEVEGASNYATGDESEEDYGYDGLGEEENDEYARERDYTEYDQELSNAFWNAQLDRLLTENAV